MLAEMYNKFCLLTGENALWQLLNHLLEWEAKCIEYLETNRAMLNLTKAQCNRNLLKRPEAASAPVPIACSMVITPIGVRCTITIT